MPFAFLRLTFTCNSYIQYYNLSTNTNILLWNKEQTTEIYEYLFKIFDNDKVITEVF